MARRRAACAVAYDKETAGALHDASKGHSREHVAAESELLLVLGGDGTLLAAARVAAPKGIPILPINMGSLGFLTSFMLEELYPALEDILAGRLTISERVMLQVELHRAGKILDKQSVLNEVVVNKGALARMIELELTIDNDFCLPLSRRRLDRRVARPARPPIRFPPEVPSSIRRSSRSSSRPFARTHSATGPVVVRDTSSST